MFTSWCDNIHVNAFPISIVSTSKVRQSTLALRSGSENQENSDLTRREIVILALGGAAYAKVVSSAVSKIKRGDAYPEEHESKVKTVFEKTILEAAKSKDYSDRPLRILEIGIGSNCKTVVRGFYDETLRKLSDMNLSSREIISGVEMYGIDIDPPPKEVVELAREKLNDQQYSMPIKFQASYGDIEKGLLSFRDGFFDAITCSLVLCSVHDQQTSLKEIKRLLNPTNAYFGYVEHVAVDLERDVGRDKSFLDWQQRTLDPLQQVVAHNCHLHRTTDEEITKVFQTYEVLLQDRFFVDEMWPVSCQSMGVIKVNNS